MPQYEETIKVNFLQKQVYDLIADVEQYPEFLPWCAGVRITSRSENKFTAELLVKYKSFRESYTSEVILIPSKQIIIKMVDGPFKHLYNTWSFKEIDCNSSEAKFRLDFEFSSPVLGIVIGTIFDKAVKKITNAFIERASSIYS